jgi:hypothetical protein
VPPKTEVVKPHPKYDDVRCSARDDKGEFVPGTLVVRDIRTKGRLGSEHLLWSASMAIKKVLKVDINSGTYQGVYAMRGLSVLPEVPTREMVAEVEKEGFNRYRAWKIKEARTVVSDIEARNEALLRAGMKPRESSAEYAEARAILDAADVSDRIKAEEMLELVIGKKPPSDPLRVYEDTKPDDLTQLKEELGDLKAAMADLLASKKRRAPNKRKTA